MSDLEDDGLMGLAVQANMARLYKGGQREFVEELAGVLGKWLPEETQVERRGSLFGEKRISAVRVHLGEFIYSIEIPARGAPAASLTKVVRGIKLKTEVLPVEEWLALVADALGRFAATNQQARDALSAFVDNSQER